MAASKGSPELLRTPFGRSSRRRESAPSRSGKGQGRKTIRLLGSPTPSSGGLQPFGIIFARPSAAYFKGYAARSMTRRLFTCAYYFMVPVARGKTVEAKKPVPHMGTYWVGGASGATGYRVKSLLGLEPKMREVASVVGINQRISLRKYIDDIRRWVDQGR